MSEELLEKYTKDKEDLKRYNLLILEVDRNRCITLILNL